MAFYFYMYMVHKTLTKISSKMATKVPLFLMGIPAAVDIVYCSAYFYNPKITKKLNPCAPVSYVHIFCVRKCHGSKDTKKPVSKKAAKGYHVKTRQKSEGVPGISATYCITWHIFHVGKIHHIRP